MEAQLRNAFEAIGSFLWPPSRMRTRRGKFLANREPLGDQDFLSQIRICGPLASAVAIALRRTIASGCSVPGEMLYPSDSINALCGIIGLGNPYFGWLNDDYPGDPIDFPRQFERELHTISPKFPCDSLTQDWFDKLPHFHPTLLGIFRRRKRPICFGDWIAESVSVIFNEKDLEGQSQRLAPSYHS